MRGGDLQRHLVGIIGEAELDAVSLLPQGLGTERAQPRALQDDRRAAGQGLRQANRRALV